MARQIAATPVLKDRGAATFIRAIKNPKPYTPPVIDMERLNKHVTEALRKRAEK